MTEQKHTCEQCKKEFELDKGFLNIADICEGTEYAMELYETSTKFKLSNFWCAECAESALFTIENCDYDYDPEPDYDAKTAEETAHEQYEIYTTLK
jgi:hypothetical protein